MSNDVRESIAAEVRAEMARKGKTQDDLAKLLNLAQPSISLRIRGERAWRAEELVAVARFLGVPVAQFVDTAPASTGSAA